MIGSAVVGSKEMINIVKDIASDKGISIDETLDALTKSIEFIEGKRYGGRLDVKCKIDHKLGAIKIYGQKLVVEDSTKVDYEHDSSVIRRKDLPKDLSNLNVGETYLYDLPPMRIDYSTAQLAKEEILKRIKAIEKQKEYNEFKDRKGDCVLGVVKKIGLKNIVVDVNGYEAVLHKDHLIPNEIFRVEDNIRAYVFDVVSNPEGAQILLSRTHPEFLAGLFSQEVPEIYDGTIKIIAVARDPGSRAKIVVHSEDSNVNPISLCIGLKGNRIKSIMSELRGEKIDVVKYDNNIGQYVMNLFYPLQFSKIMIDEDAGTVDIIAEIDDLKRAVGAKGQNIRLCSRILGYKINAVSEGDVAEKESEQRSRIKSLLVEALDVEDIIADLLIIEGYKTPELVASASIKNIASIEGFDEDIAKELKDRADNWLKNNED